MSIQTLSEDSPVTKHEPTAVGTVADIGVKILDICRKFLQSNPVSGFSKDLQIRVF